jgi:hypothetical protein
MTSYNVLFLEFSSYANTRLWSICRYRYAYTHERQIISKKEHAIARYQLWQQRSMYRFTEIPEFKCTQMCKFKLINFINSFPVVRIFKIASTIVLLFPTYDTGENISVFCMPKLRGEGIPQIGAHCVTCVITCMTIWRIKRAMMTFIQENSSIIVH